MYKHKDIQVSYHISHKKLYPPIKEVGNVSPVRWKQMFEQNGVEIKCGKRKSNPTSHLIWSLLSWNDTETLSTVAAFHDSNQTN